MSRIALCACQSGLWPLGPLKKETRDTYFLFYRTAENGSGKARLFIDAELLKAKLKTIMDFLELHAN